MNIIDEIINSERLLEDIRLISATSETGHSGQISTVAAHSLDNEDTSLGADSGLLDLVAHGGDLVEGRVRADAEIGAGYVVGDGGWHAHTRDSEGLVLVALLVELQHRRERLEAADDEQALDLELFDALRQDVEAHRFRVGSWATKKADADACPPVKVHPAELFDA